ncbi:MAG TPA: arginine--tRNA ligase [Bacteroidia bacterium]|nr:arginine--tRNA ligase [Bacteroidia bacterium]
MKIESLLSEKISLALSSLFNLSVKPESIGYQKTNKEFEGDITLVVFPFVKASAKPPEETGRLIGEYLKANAPEVVGFNVVKGFLNLVISDLFWISFFRSQVSDKQYGLKQPGTSGRTIMLEYSSPNTNKPLHLGHIRNNLLGSSVSNILQANGNRVIKTNLVNDRGIHICKSMLAWQKWGQGETPVSSGLKGDHLVGKYYVEFDKRFKEEVKVLESAGIKKEDAEKQAPLMQEIQQMLLRWEAGDPETISLWKMMNSWVYDGFDITYRNLGISFDKMYYESQTYLLGKNIVQEGLAKGVFYKKDDGSVWIDLSKEKLDQKVLLRSDGTSVYMTQDLGTAAERFREYPELDQLIYTVANEQDYHFKVLFLILDKMGYAQAKNCYHLSYGMVELPEGKMKSREGTVVDADDLMEEMISTAKAMTLELGKVDEFTAEEAELLYKQIGLAALKYFILKVDPKKKMVFDPKESIDFNGNTGPFIQYTHARIQSLLRKASKLHDTSKSEVPASLVAILPVEKELLKSVYRFPEALQQSAHEYNPGVVANYVYELSKEYSTYYQTVPILKEENPELIGFRLLLSGMTARIIRSSMGLLGIEVPERM